MGDAVREAKASVRHDDEYSVVLQIPLESEKWTDERLIEWIKESMYDARDFAAWSTKRAERPTPGELCLRVGEGKWQYRLVPDPELHPRRPPAFERPCDLTNEERGEALRPEPPANPLARKVLATLEALGNADGEPASVASISTHAQEPVWAVREQLRKLVRSGLVEQGTRGKKYIYRLR